MTPELLAQIREDYAQDWTNRSRPSFNSYTAAADDVGLLLGHVDAAVESHAAELDILKAQHRDELARAWEAGFLDRRLGTHERDDNPYRENEGA